MKFIDWLTDNLAVFLAVGVGIATVATMFTSFAPDIPFKIVTGILGGSMVLFQVRALVKRMHLLWWFLAVLIVFCDVSFVLNMTSQQKGPGVALVDDSGYAKLDHDVTEARNNVSRLIDQQLAAQNRVTIDTIAEQIKLAQSGLEKAQSARNTYRTPESVMDARGLFMAIPNAVGSLELFRWMTLAFSILAAVILQMTIIATVKGAVKRAKSEDRAQASPKRRRRRKVSAPVEPVDIPAIEPEDEQEATP